MCMLCSDAVDRCRICHPNSRAVYSLGDTWCAHLTQRHGTDSASHYAHFAWGEHEGDDCECVAGDWWEGRPPPVVEDDDA